MSAGNARLVRSTINQCTLQLAAFCLIAYSSSFAGIYTSPCTMENDPATQPDLLALCLEGKAGVWVEQRSKTINDTQPATVYGSHGQASGLIGNWLTLQARGHARISQGREKNHFEDKEIASESAIVQIGNSAIHRHRLFGGIGAIPFGLNIDTTADWTNLKKDRHFFGSPIHIVGYSYDNQKDLTWTISGGSRNEESDDAQSRIAAIGTRLIYDMAALEGTRAIVSFSTTELSERRGGIALLNRNGKGEQTTVEIVRKWTQFPYDPTDFDQLIRINWSGKIDDVQRGRAQYEDILNQSRVGTLTYYYIFMPHMQTSVSVGYHKDETSLEPNFWFGIFGLEVFL